ncbi:MAG: hypothetical protein IJ737_01565 [Ruminococcus sp.]|nr:hypothetical protein [Ruminococcus sp.]MBR2282988.1 hypothetical protein [Ruminococcus sp.]
MPENTNTPPADIYKRRRRIFLGIVLLLFTAALGSVLYMTRDSWLSKLRGVGKPYQVIENSGRLAEGNFPIAVGGGSGWQLGHTGRELAVLSDTFVYFYDNAGALLRSRQHEYASPVMRTAGGRVLIYESGGSRYSVEDSRDIIYDGSIADDDEPGKTILFARMSDEGYTAIVTTSESFECELKVLSRTGSTIYDRKCVGRVSGVGFRDGSSGCVLSYLSAEKGAFVTSVQAISFSENKEMWTSPGLDSLGLEVYGFEGGAFVLGKETCGYIDSVGGISSYYRYEGELAGGDSENGSSAVIVNNEDRRKYSAVLFEKAGEPVIISYDEPLVDVKVSGGLAYVLSKSSITAYSFDGTVRAVAPAADSYTGMIRSGKYIFLKGFTEVQRIDFDS